MRRIRVRRRGSKAFRFFKGLFKFLMFILIPMALAVGGTYVYNNYIKPPGIPSVNKLVKEKKEQGFSDKDENQIDISNYANPLPERREDFNNYDIMGRIEIPNLGIDALIVRTDNNDFYLNYNLYKDWDGLGVPFFDYRNTNLAEDWQINIYGHNTKREEFYDQLPFTNLEAYADQDIFNNYKDVYLSIDEKQMHYEVVAIKILTDGSNEHMKVVFRNSADYLQHINRVVEGSMYTSENSYFTADDRSLIMQICHYNPDGSYMLVICKEKK